MTAQGPKMKTKITAKQIKAVLKEKPYFLGINLYPNEPSTGCHAVSILKGHTKEAICYLTQQGFISGHAHAFGPYSEGIWVKRSSGRVDYRKRV